jgi:hypothetical protein
MPAVFFKRFLVMSTIVVPTLPAGQWLRLSNVDWMTYSRLLRAFAESPGVRLTYDRGELEIIAPLFRHDYDSRFLGSSAESCNW